MINIAILYKQKIKMSRFKNLTSVNKILLMRAAVGSILQFSLPRHKEEGRLKIYILKAHIYSSAEQT